MAVLGGAALVAGMLFVSPAQAALSCQSVPGQTIGTDVKVGPVVQRVPAIANIKLCYGTGTVPVASVTTYGGTCTSNCLTVTVGGGDVDLEGVSLNWTEDGIARSVPVNPDPIDGVGGTCVLSVGIPDAPNPNCFVAIGPDDPTGTTGPIVATVNEALDDAVELALDVVDLGYGITCANVPEVYYNGYYYYFCDDPVGWSSALANSLVADGYDTACGRIPSLRDPQTGYRYYFCDDPVGWTNAAINTAENLLRSLDVQACDSLFAPVYNPNTGSYHYFCDDPAGWTVAVVANLCQRVCEQTSLQEWAEAVRRLLSDEIRIELS